MEIGLSYRNKGRQIMKARKPIFSKTTILGLGIITALFITVSSFGLSPQQFTVLTEEAPTEQETVEMQGFGGDMHEELQLVRSIASALIY